MYIFVYVNGTILDVFGRCLYFTSCDENYVHSGEREMGEIFGR